MHLKKVFFPPYLQELHKQLEEAIQDGEIWVMQLKDTEYELEGSRDRVQQQANEILHKASENNVMTKLHFSSYDTESLKLQCESCFFLIFFREVTVS